MSSSKRPAAKGTKRYLFSYGTLLPRHAPPEIAPTVRRLRRVGRGSVQGQLYDLGQYPGAILSRGGPMVVGQVFELPDDPGVLTQLDEYEGFDPSRPRGSLFVRKRCLVRLNNGEKLACWIYTYNRPLGQARPLAGGNYSTTRNYKPR
ncbi:MAG TPA: gamma-glutamylcyclotransferase family protein [Terriglobales bacterium]|nr:gamma-glutamylcyclotransferase family protein [Terriglobales bacterium]